MRKMMSRIKPIFLVSMVVAYLSFATSALALFVKLELYPALVFGFIMFVTALFANFIAMKQSFNLGEEVDAAGKIIRLNLYTAAILYFSLMGFAISGRSITSFFFDFLGMAIIFFLWQVIEKLSLHFIDREIERLEPDDHQRP